VSFQLRFSSKQVGTVSPEFAMDTGSPTVKQAFVTNERLTRKGEHRCPVSV
jgi:hypothetical protein